MEKTSFHTLSEASLWQHLDSGPRGLSAREARRRLEHNGRNELNTAKSKSLLSIFLSQFGDFMIWVLIGAAVISLVLREYVDAGIIGTVVLLNGILGAIQESRAEAALLALKQMAAPKATVWRDGGSMDIPADELVVGDVVLLEAGDQIPADLRLIEAQTLRVEESALTGESVPVEKAVVTLHDARCPLGDRVNLAYMGTAASYGRGRGVVVACGMDTEMGAIARELESTEKELTPLQKKLNQISNTLSIGVLGIAVVIFLLGLLGGLGDVFELFLTSVSLAVAAIPEGMVAVVTIVLAMGMSHMAKSGAIVRRLPAVETLGSTQIICSDKTGTLTQNKMTVVETSGGHELPAAMGHCNDSHISATGEVVGDPTENALLNYLLEKNLWTMQQIESRRREGEIPFDSERKLSSVAVAHKGMLRVYVKGAPDVLLSRCVNTDEGVPLDAKARREILWKNEDMAGRALRVLAFAYRDIPLSAYRNQSTVETELTYCGLVGMIDPARPEVKAAIATCKRAGIRPVMITGDHKVTAMAIARDLGILPAKDAQGGPRAITGAELDAMDEQTFAREVDHIAVYARVSPEHKTRIVSAWQKRGCIVAMTGDGVNDAPALRQADIGVGMGITGTDVSKGASDMILTDDNFATIVGAVREGRRIYDNIHKTVRFLLSSNAGEVLSILAATLAGFTLLKPVHILWINLVTDTFPALALGMEPGEDDTMRRKPRDPAVPFFTGREWVRIGLVGAAEAALTLAAYFIGNGGALGMTMAFLTLSLTQLFAAVGFQSERHSLFSMHPGKHMFLWLAFAGSTLLQVIVVLFPPLREMFGLVALAPANWLGIAALCIVMLGVVEFQKWVARARHDED